MIILISGTSVVWFGSFVLAVWFSDDNQVTHPHLNFEQTNVDNPDVDISRRFSWSLNLFWFSFILLIGLIIVAIW